MNTGFSSWNEKHIKVGSHIDPTFGRHPSDFPTVDDVTAVAVANAQQQQQQRGAPQETSLLQMNNGNKTNSNNAGNSNSSNSGNGLSNSNNLNNNNSVVQNGQDITHGGDPLKKSMIRPISNTKRAAQNRSAQKAFRLRKEKYIKDLEEQVNEVQQLKQTIEELRAENLQLRDYTLALQSRVIELSPAAHAPQHGAPDQVPAPPASVFNGNKMFSRDNER